jgi:prepilin-type N-terminal cleavage/methylation domain-containing protein
MASKMRIKMKHPSKRNNFTMVEIMVVIAIIGILLGLGLAGYKITWKRIRESRTQAALQKMKLAIESFKTQNGYYPQGKYDPSDALATRKEKYQVINSSQDGIIDVPDANETNRTFKAIIIPEDNTWKLAKILNLSEMRENHGDTYTVSGKDYLVVVDAYHCIYGGRVKKGRPIYYVIPGDKNPSTYDLYSAGPDGNPGSYKSGASNAEKEAAKDNIWAK